MPKLSKRDQLVEANERATLGSGQVAGMELRRLTIFRAAAECASFKQAADRLAVKASEAIGFEFPPAFSAAPTR